MFNVVIMSMYVMERDHKKQGSNHTPGFSDEINRKRISFAHFAISTQRAGRKADAVCLRH